MEFKDYITAIGVLISSLLVIAGWIFTKYKDIEHEKFKIRHARREEFVRAFLEVDEIISRTQGKVGDDATFIQKWVRLTALIRLYGTKEENKELENFAYSFFGDSKSIEKANIARNRLNTTLIHSIRHELGFK